MNMRRKKEIEEGEAKPEALPLVPGAIPQALRECAQWVVWKYERRQDRKGQWEWTKIPVNPRTGTNASSTEPDTWGSFAEALATLQAHPELYAGIGFVFSPDDPFCGVDLDDCRDLETGTVQDWAAQIVAQFASYTELSPTRTGLKIFLRAVLPKGRKRRGPIEMYDRGRYFTLTGQHIAGTPTTVEERQSELERLQESLGKKPCAGKAEAEQGQGHNQTLSDAELIQKAMAAANGEQFSRLWSGDTTGYPSPSEADLALCSHLAFWTGGDRERMAALFAQSGLYRDKWERADYRASTIEKALEGRTEFYSSREHKDGKPANATGNEKVALDGRSKAKKPRRSYTPNEAADDPHRLARLFMQRHCDHPEAPRLRNWREEWHWWDHTTYRVIAERELRARLTACTKEEFDRLNIIAQKTAEAKGEPAPDARRVTQRLIGDVAHAFASMTILPGRIEPPAWIDKKGASKGPFPAHEVLATASGLVHLPSLVRGTNYLHPCTPAFFSPNALRYAFDLDAAAPSLWLEFLGKLWPDDRQSVNTLQEWMGYLLTPDTRQQKILLLVGPKRSGKGTVARVIRELVGPDNMAGPTLSSLATNFGLWPLLGKSVAIVSDARLSGRTDSATVTERLLSISGEDALTVDRKNLTPVTAKLTSRFMILTNELPRLGDASGALTGRMIVLRLTRSWYGKEDTTLTDRLLGELPGILLWAIQGWQRLGQRGYFIQPEAGQELLGELEDLSSPIGAFIRERCIVEPGCRVSVDAIFAAWKRWCEQRGRKEPGTEAVFGRDLLAAVPSVRKTRPRDGDERYRAYEGIGLRE